MVLCPARGKLMFDISSFCDDGLGPLIKLRPREGNEGDQGNLGRLAVVRGKLRFEDVAYETVRCAASESFCPQLHETPVNRPCNLFGPGNVNIPWKIEIRNRHLNVKFEDSSLGLVGDPMTYLRTASISILAARCSHDKDAQMIEPDRWAVYLTPSGPAYAATLDDGGLERIFVVAVAGDDRLRFMALAGIGIDSPTVIRGDACLECCLTLCRKAGFRYVIA